MTTFSCRVALAFLTLAVLGDFSVQAQALTGHVPAVVSRLVPVDRLAGSNRLNLAIGLPLQNQPALTNLLIRLYDRTDPNYRHFLTPQEFTERFGPSERDYEKVISFAESNGLTVTHRHSNRMMVNVNGTVADIEKALHVRLLVYPHPEGTRTFYAPEVEPTPELAVPILHIGGLDNYFQPRPAGMRAGALGTGSVPAPNGGSGSGGAYLGADFRKAYAPGVLLDGSGQSVGLLEFDGYYTNDITAYETLAGLTNTISNTVVANVLLDGYLGTPGPNNGEVALDIELALSMAPGLSQVVVYTAGPQGSADDILNRMATDNVAKQLSSSWTWGAADDLIASQIFLEFAAQGQSFFNSAGDTDAYSTSIPFPTDNPYITIVGGTTLATASDKSWSSETVWNMNNGQGSGGGISSRYAIPVWQQGLNLNSSHGSASNRNFPDVAMVADNVWAIYNDGQGSAFVGTSCAAPLWAAFMALANEQGAVYGQAPVGFLNPAIYANGQGANYTTVFHDITTGNNTNSLSPTQFFAVAGYDLCTGWGTPAGQPLINALQPQDYMVISPQSGFSANGQPGGPFNPSAQNLTVSNHGPDSLTWTAGTTAAWLSISPTNGTLASGSPATQVTASLNSNAFNLAGGVYSAFVSFNNQASGVTRARRFDLRIAQSLLQNGGFESGDFSSWTLAGNPFANFVASGSPIAPHSGRYAAAFGQAGSTGFLSQNLLTSAGQAYLLSFWLQNPTGATPNLLQLNWNTAPSLTNTIFGRTNLDAFAWTNFQFLVVAEGTNSTLQFGFRDDPQTLGLDDVSLIPIPTPALGIAAENNGALTFSWAAFPGLTYQVQFKNDLTQTNWQNLGAAIVASNASLLITDPINPATNRFYRVVVSP